MSVKNVGSVNFRKSLRPGQSKGQQQVQNHYDLRCVTTVELLEMLLRQRRILHDKSLMAKLADRGENIKGLVNRIENELKARGELKNAGAQKVEADGGEKNEGTMVNEEVKSSLSEKASDPLLNDLKQEENEDLDPSAEQIILSETTTNGPDTAEEKTDDDEKKKGDGKHSTGESKEPLSVPKETKDCCVEHQPHSISGHLKRAASPIVQSNENGIRKHPKRFILKMFGTEPITIIMPS